MDLGREFLTPSQPAAEGDGGAAPTAGDRWDAAIGAALRDVPVPAGLQSRILERLAAARSPLPIPIATQESAPASSALPRRSFHLRRSLLSAAVAFLFVAGAWSLGLLTKTPEPTVTLKELLPAEWDLESLPALTEAEWPEGWRAVSGLTLGVWKTAPVPGWQNAASLAVASFKFRHRLLRQEVSGELLALPEQQCNQPPTATNLADGEIRYFGSRAYVAWTCNGRVYVCRMNGGAAGALDRLRQTILDARPVT